MKISIITATKDDGEALRLTIDSVYSCNLPAGVEIEHIIVDGGKDESVVIEYAASKGSRVIRTSPKGVYNALNTGIAAATGDIIGLVHGSDFLTGRDVLSRVAKAFADDAALDFVYGDVNFCEAGHPGRIVRYYSGAGFTPELLLKGFAPPHPSLFIRAEVMKNVGPYREDMVLAGDFDLFLRLFRANPPLRYLYLPGPAVTMSTGGLSSGLLTRFGKTTTEICMGLRDRGLPHSRLRILSRFFLRAKRKSLSADD